MKRTLLAVVPLLLLGACATQHSGPCPVAAAGAQQTAAFDHLKSLAGKWEGKTHDGQAQTVVFTVSSNGSIVHETMFPGTDHEMVNVYHLDGPSILVTHYCAMGNQPHMRATGEENHAIAFHCDSVSNWAGNDQMYMGDLTLAWKDKDHISETWCSTQAGKLADKPMSFELARAK